MTEVPEAGRIFTDRVAVNCEPCEEDWHIELWFDPREGLEWMSEVVDVENERWPV